jgi:hypothetical protein
MRSLRTFSFLVVVLLGVSSASAQDVELRPVDRATVRVIGVGGARTARVVGRSTGVARLPALPTAGYGTGVYAGAPDLVVTAAHVVRGMDVVAIVNPGESEGRPARVVFVHPEHDVAVLRTGAPSPHHLRLGQRDPALRMSEEVSASGYPIDHRERYPAASSGAVARVNNDGSLQLSIGVNPGNSGGPVVNRREELIGIVTARGEPNAGVQNIGLVVPVRYVRESCERARAVLEREPIAFREEDRLVARVVTDLVRTSDEHPLYEQTSLSLLSAAAAAPRTPEQAAIVASHAWNMSLALMEARRSVAPADLGAEDRRTVEQLLAISLRLAQRVDTEAPYIRAHYPVVRSIVVSDGRPYVGAPR